MSRRTKRNLLLASIAVLVLGVGLVIANVVLSDRYGPSKPVIAFIEALQHRDAQGAFDQLAPQQSTTASTYSAYLLTPSAIAQQLAQDSSSSGVPSDPAVIDVHMGPDGTTASVDVSYTLGSQHLTTTYQVQEIGGQHNLLVYPVWKLIPPVATVQINAPNSVESVQVNSQSVALHGGSGTVAVLPGLTRVVMKQSVLLYGQTRTASLSGPGATATVTFGSTVLPSALSAANSALDAAFAACAASISLTPPNNCPFSDGAGLNGQVSSVVWAEGALPSSLTTWALNSQSGVLDSSGSVPMSVTYLVTTNFGSGPQQELANRPGASNLRRGSNSEHQWIHHHLQQLTATELTATFEVMADSVAVNIRMCI